MALADDDVHITLDHRTTFRTLGDPVDIRLSVIDVHGEVDLRGELAYDDWQRIFSTGAFHLDDEDPPSGWEPGPEIKVVLRLRRPIAATFANADEFVEALFTKPEGPLRHSEAWLMLEATQEVPVPGQPDASAGVGIRTSWAPSLLED
jgi:hypothetical protein